LGDNVYNPLDILKFIKNGFMFKSYWWESGSPYSLIEILKTKEFYLPSLQNLKTDKTLLNSFDIENIQLESLLFQAGYLTIDSVTNDGFDIEYKLKVPNLEVQISLNRLILDYLTKKADITTIKTIRNSLLEANLEDFKQTLISLFASIPYNNYVKNNISSFEGFYASVVYAYLASLGIKIVAEDVTNKGRIDITLQFKDKVYIIEFKVADDLKALTQIKQKNYYQKYLNQNKEIYLIGINFDEDEKNISEFEWERV
jgi:Holliday junction resolvase-like predicted endonuclease